MCLLKSSKKFKLEKVLKEDSLDYALIGVKIKIDKQKVISLDSNNNENDERILTNLAHKRFAGMEELEEFILPVMKSKILVDLCYSVPFRTVCVCGQAGLKYNYIIAHKDKIANQSLTATDLKVVGSSCFRYVSKYIPSILDMAGESGTQPHSYAVGEQRCAGSIYGFNPDCKWKFSPSVALIKKLSKEIQNPLKMLYYNSKLWKTSGLCYDCKNIYVDELMKPIPLLLRYGLYQNAYTMFQTEKNRDNLFSYYNYMKDKQLHNKDEDGNRMRCLMICFTKKLMQTYAELNIAKELNIGNII